MYHADTNSHRVHAHDYDIRTGGLSNRRVFLDLTATGERPDGAAVDAAGNYWVAFYGAGKVVQFSPAGKRLPEILLPVKAPTMPCFGGRSEAHTSELQSLMRNSYAVFCLPTNINLT